MALVACQGAGSQVVHCCPIRSVSTSYQVRVKHRLYGVCTIINPLLVPGVLYIADAVVDPAHGGGVCWIR